MQRAWLTLLAVVIGAALLAGRHVLSTEDRALLPPMVATLAPRELARRAPGAQIKPPTLPTPARDGGAATAIVEKDEWGEPVVTFVGVVLEPDGGPAVGALVRMGRGDEQDPRSDEVEADSTGHFHIRVYPEPPYWAAAEKGETYVSLEGLLPGAAELTLRLRPKLRLRGIVDPGVGPAVSGFTVQVLPGGVEQHFPASRFELDGVRAAAVTLTVETDDKRHGSLALDLRQAPPDEVRVPLHGQVQGRLVVPDGGIPEGFFSLGYLPKLEPGSGQAPDEQFVDLGPGEVRFLDVSVGRHVLRFERLGAQTARYPFEVRYPGEHVDLGDLHLPDDTVPPGEIGASVGAFSDEAAIDVLWVAPGGPAATAGLSAGDELAEIDGEPTSGGSGRTRLTVEQVEERLRGPPGSKVTVAVWRGPCPRWGDHKPEECEARLLTFEVGRAR